MATQYVILRTVNPDGADLLEAVGLSEGHGAEQAIRKLRDTIVEAEQEGETTWHAVPVGNWTTITAAVEVPEPRVVYSEGAVPFAGHRVAPDPPAPARKPDAVAAADDDAVAA